MEALKEEEQEQEAGWEFTGPVDYEPLREASERTEVKVLYRATMRHNAYLLEGLIISVRSSFLTYVVGIAGGISSTKNYKEDIEFSCFL